MLQLEQQSASSVYSHIWQLAGTSPGTVGQNTCTWFPHSIVASDFYYVATQGFIISVPENQLHATLPFMVQSQKSYSRSYIASLLLYRFTSLYCGSNARGGTQIHLSVGEVSQNLQTCFKTTTLIQQIVSSPLCPGTVLRTSQQAVIEILNFSSSLQYIWT